MKTILAVFIFQFGFFGLIQATDSKLIDGKVIFPVATVNDQIAWTKEEKITLQNSFSAISATTSLVVETTAISPTVIEVNLSTCIIRFDNFSDWINCQTKQGLTKKLRDINNALEDAIDVDDSQVIQDLTERESWLLSYARSLP